MEKKLNLTPTQLNSPELTAMVEVNSFLSDIKKDVKQFVTLMLMTAFMIILIGIGSFTRENIIQNEQYDIPAYQINASILEGLLGEELPRYDSKQSTIWLSPAKLTMQLFEKMSSATLSNMNSVVTAEMLYSGIDEQSVLISGQIGEYKNDGFTAPVDTPQDITMLEDEKEGETANDLVSKEGTSDDGPGINEPTQLVNGGVDKSKPLAFIYHTHNREAWSHSDSKNAQSKDQNITLVGKRLAEELEKNGVPTMVSSTDYLTEVPDYEWEYSYKFSKKTVKEALASNDELQYVFDIHRDSQPREYTTVEIDGESYAQVYFIIGQRNTNWQENKEFATKLNNKLDEQYPGLSRGIWGKNANSGNAEYNQSLFEQSVLIEVGGVDNTLDENYRTAKALANVIAQVHAESMAR